MGKRLDSEKFIAWQARLAKLDASGLSVTAFCRQEDITPARYYYWSRRVREAGSAAQRMRHEVRDRIDRQASDIASHIEVVIGEHVKIRLPANDHDLISSVLASLQSSAVVANAAGAFERIEVSRSSAAPR